MRDACVRAVNAAMRESAGRDLNAAEIRDIEVRVNRHMRDLARQNPREWSAKPEAERLTDASVAAARELVAEHRRRKQNLETQVVRMAAADDYMTAQVASGADSLHLTALERELRGFADGRDGAFVAADSRMNGGLKVAIAAMTDALEAGRGRGIWKYLPFNEPGTDRMLRRALAGLTDGVPQPVLDAIKAMNEYIDLLVARANAAGARIGHLEDWGEVHRWSRERIAAAVKKHGEAAVVDRFVRGANPRRYINTDGSRMNEAQMREFMTEALRSIRFDGANKRERAREAGDAPSPYATGSPANRGSAHREIHLTPEATVELLNDFSEYGAMESMVQHVRSLSRQVAMLETFGPNYEVTWRSLADRAVDRDVLSGLLDESGAKKRRGDLDNLFDHVSGNYTFQGYRRLAAAGSTIRSIEAALHLGFAKFASITDIPVMYFTAASRGLDLGKLWIADVAAWTGQGRRWAKRAGLLTDTVMGFADRYGYDNFNVRDLGAKAASFTMKTTGLNWDTEGRRQAYGMVMMDTIGHLTRRYGDMAKMKEDDVRFARFLNIDQQVWNIWRLARLETQGRKHTLLTPEAIFAIPDAEIARLVPGENPALVRMQAAERLLGIIAAETDNAVITAGAKDRAELLGDQRRAGRGTWAGEFRRSLVLFKSFPWAFFRRQMEVARSIDNGANRMAYGVSLFIAMSTMGIISNWIYDILSGRDPRFINILADNPRDREIAWRNILAGALKGGGLGVVGDLVFPAANPGARPQSLAANMMGPTVRFFEDTYNLTWGNLNQAFMGEKTDFGPESVRYVQQHATPNYWYSKLAFDRLLFERAQEELSPGYAARMQRRAYQTRGTSFWWAPAEPLPSRAPNFAAAYDERAN